jgi:hypothetical protein
MAKMERDDAIPEISEPENLVCSLATALLHHVDTLDNMLGEAFSEPLDMHLLHHLAYRAGYEGHGEHVLQMVQESVALGVKDAAEGQEAKITHQAPETRQ